jgi:hypothetical protein
VRDDEVRPEAARDVEHLCGHLDARRRHRERAHLEPLHLGEVGKNLQRLLACGIVVVEIRDLLAFQVSAEPLLGELDRGRGLRPVARGEREEVGVTFAVGRGGRAEARRCPEDLVLLELLGEGRRLRRAVEAVQHGAFLLEALVRLHRRRHLVFVVDLDDTDLVALHAPLAVQQADVVVIAWAQEQADRLGRAGPVALQTDDDLLLLRCESTAPQRQSASRRSGAPPFEVCHCCFLLADFS